MKILHLLNSDKYSGAENVACQIIQMMAEEHAESAYASPNGPIGEALADKGIRFFPMEKVSSQEVRRVIKEFQPDVIHAHDMGASFNAALVCKRIPLISHIHNNNFNSRGVSPKSIAYLLAGWKAKHIFWVSDSSYKGYCFHSLFAPKSTVLYNIIDTESVCRNAEEDPNQYPYDVIYIGRLTYQKNPQRLMEVFSKVAKQRPGTKFAVVGLGELEEETKKLAQQLNLEKNVDFLGFRKNPHKMLKGAKVMVMTSRWEGTPMCALEAQALGVPIVSTPADGLTALVKNDETGYLSESDDVLAEKILQVLNNKDLHQSLSVNAVAQSKVMNNKEQYKKTIWAEYPERNSCSAVPN